MSVDSARAAAGHGVHEVQFYPSFIKLVRTPAGVVDLGEGFAEVAGQGAGGGDGVVAGLDLDGAVSPCGLDELAD